MDILTTVLTVARFAAFLVSVTGYVFLARDRLHARIRYSWIFVLSCMTCLIYFAGLVGLLEIAVWVVFGAGACCLSITSRAKRPRSSSTGRR